MATPLPDPQLPPSPQDALQSIQRNFDALAQAKPAFTVRAGEETLTFSAASTATVTITHDLGTTPVAVVATADRDTGGGDLWNVAVGSLGATTFVAEVSHIAGGTGTTAKIYWLAIAV